MGEREPQELVADVERLLDDIDRVADPVARAAATELVGTLVELYGAGLERIVEELAARDDDGELARALAGDDLVSHLLLLHGLHPVPLAERVAGALAEVRPYLESHGGGVELVAVQDATVRLTMRGSCSGCPSSAVTLKLAIEDAIHKAAPEIEHVVAQEEAAPPLLQIEVIAPAVAGAWEVAGDLAELADGGAAVRSVGGQPILFAALGGQRYGYRPLCPACGSALGGDALHGAELACAGCGHHYDVMRAGRCLDVPDLHLEPVPLLVGEDGRTRVALAAAG